MSEESERSTPPVATGRELKFNNLIKQTGIIQQLLYSAKHYTYSRRETKLVSVRVILWNMTCSVVSHRVVVVGELISGE